jgi:hypothetical protein
MLLRCQGVALAVGEVGRGSMHTADVVNMYHGTFGATGRFAIRTMATKSITYIFIQWLEGDLRVGPLESIGRQCF